MFFYLIFVLLCAPVFENSVHIIYKFVLRTALDFSVNSSVVLVYIVPVDTRNYWSVCTDITVLTLPSEHDIVMDAYTVYFCVQVGKFKPFKRKVFSSELVHNYFEFFY